MPTPTCQKCRRTIPSDEINVAQDVAYCRACNLSYRLSELTFDDGITSNLDLQRPPSGAWFDESGVATVIGATNRSLGTAVGMLFFALFWNGIVSVFVALALAGTLQQFHVTPPTWFPSPNMNDDFMKPGMIAFLWLFLLPFIVIGLAFIGTVLSCLLGRTEVRIANSKGIIFIGVGGLGWRRRFDASQIKAIKLHTSNNREGSNSVSVMLETREGKQLKFGSLLTNERRQFILAALRKTILR